MNVKKRLAYGDKMRKRLTYSEKDEKKAGLS